MLQMSPLNFLPPIPTSKCLLFFQRRPRLDHPLPLDICLSLCLCHFLRLDRGNDHQLTRCMCCGAPIIPFDCGQMSIDGDYRSRRQGVFAWIGQQDVGDASADAGG